MLTTYYVIETQTGDTPAALVTVFQDLAQAKQKYYQVMAAAAVSKVPKHGCMILADNMFVIMSGVEIHIEPDPDPNSVV